MMQRQQTKQESTDLIMQHENSLRNPFDMSLYGKKLKDRSMR